MRLCFQVLLLMVSASLLVACSKNKKKETLNTAQPESAVANESAPESTAEAEPGSKTGEKTELGEIIYFAFDSSDLDEAARETLNNNAEWLKEDKSRTLLIEGHTDETGTTQYNLGLGDRRARSAEQYLVRLGISESRIRVITYGEERPASSSNDRNRRSVFVATKK